MTPVMYADPSGNFPILISLGILFLIGVASFAGAKIGAAIGMFIPIVGPIIGAIVGAGIGIGVYFFQ